MTAPTTTWPAMAELRQLTVGVKHTVEDIDHNGHLHVWEHLQLCSRGIDTLLLEAGVDESYPQRTGFGLMTLGHHAIYLREALAGDELAVYPRLVERTGKVIHAVGFLVNETRGALATVMSVTAGHVDLSSRRMSPFPEPMARVYDDWIARHAALDWPMPDLPEVAIKA